MLGDGEDRHRPAELDHAQGVEPARGQFRQQVRPFGKVEVVVGGRHRLTCLDADGGIEQAVARSVQLAIPMSAVLAELKVLRALVGPTPLRWPGRKKANHR